MNLIELLEKDLLMWKSRLDEFEGLERLMIRLHLDRIETTLKIYIREKETYIQEKQELNKIK